MPYVLIVLVPQQPVGSAPTLLVNLSSALASALQSVSLRLVVTYLKRKGIPITVVEATAIKMFAAAVFVLVPTLVMEPQGFAELRAAPPVLAGLIMGGIGITLLYASFSLSAFAALLTVRECRYQSSVVALAFFTKVTTAGLVMQFRMYVCALRSPFVSSSVLICVNRVPQVLLAILLYGTYQANVYVIAGTCLVVVACVAYGIVLFIAARRQRQEDERTALLSVINVGDV